MPVRIKEYKCLNCTCRAEANHTSIVKVIDDCVRGRSCGMHSVLLAFNKMPREVIRLPNKMKEVPKILEPKPPANEDSMVVEIKDPIYICIRPNGRVKNRGS